jgi:50S ribosomal subunit-associated GTPase HflX
VFVSAVAEHGLEPLHRALAAAVRARKPLTEINISVSDGKLLSEIHQYGEVIDQRTLGDRLIVRAHLPERLAGRLKQAGARLRVE